MYSYVRKVKKVEGSTTKFDIKTTNYVYKENVEGEPQMLFTCYNDQEKATYQYFFLNNKDAVEWIKENGDKNKTYTMIDPDGIYDNTMKASWYDETGWEVGMVGAWGSITLDEYASGKPFVKKEAPSSSKDNNACTLDEFMEMYDTDFDSDEDAEDWWFDYGCENPY